MIIGRPSLVLGFIRVAGHYIIAALALLSISVVYYYLKHRELGIIFSLADHAMRPFKWLSAGPFAKGKVSIKSSMERAIKTTFLYDLGTKNFEENYSKLLDSQTHQKLKYHNFGYASAHMELDNLCIRRLRLVQAFKDIPQLADVKVRAPVFIAGLPRTGTTFLYNLLNLDPKFRAPRTWELLQPLPSELKASTTLEAFKYDRAQRRRTVHGLINMRRIVTGDSLAHIHEFGTDLPEECYYFLSDGIPILSSLFYHIFLEWRTFFTCNAVEAYDSHKKFLQILSYQTGESGLSGQKEPRTWLLKCPIHVCLYDELAKVYPDAKIIWNHRHPAQAIPSMCSLVQAVHRCFFEMDNFEAEKFGNAMKDCFEYYLSEKSTKALEDSKLDASHVLYEDLIADPIGTVKKIYKQFGWEFTDAYNTILEQYLVKNKEDRNKISAKKSAGSLHSYDMKTFGLSEEMLSSGGFAKYCKQYGIANPPVKGK